MKHDIKNLFKDDWDTSKKLPKNHRTEFLEKLKNSELKPEKEHTFSWLRIAVGIIICVGVVFLFLKDKNKEQLTPKLEIVQQIEKVQQEYLKNIDREWHQFLQLTDDQNLVKRYKEKLSDLDAEYKTIAVRFEAQPNNIIVIERLVTNLKTRLQLLKDIQAHIKLIKKENEHHENTI